MRGGVQRRMKLYHALVCAALAGCSGAPVAVVQVYSPVTGRVARLLVGVGERVVQGQPLALVSSPDVGASRSDLLLAQAELMAAEHDLARQRRLVELGEASGDYEAALEVWREAKAELERAQAKARLLGRDDDATDDHYTLIAPVAGVVLARAARPGLDVAGEYAGGMAPEALFTIGEPPRRARARLALAALALTFALALGLALAAAARRSPTTARAGD
jgi:multidrug efflux pump subunit AcrA (membrane-fusion protein)